MSADTNDAKGDPLHGLVFEWHARKAKENLRKHGVSFEEGRTLFADDHLLVAPDREHSYDEVRYLAIGRSDVGRLLTVCFTERDSVLRLISARVAEPWERREYEVVEQSG